MEMFGAQVGITGAHLKGGVAQDSAEPIKVGPALPTSVETTLPRIGRLVSAQHSLDLNSMAPYCGIFKSTSFYRIIPN